MIRVTEKQAEQAGREAGYFGPNLTNCHFTYFATPELTKAWERGNEQGKIELAQADVDQPDHQ